MHPAIGREHRRSYEFGAFRLDPAERVLRRNGDRVSLAPKAFETLFILVQHSGHAVTKDELIKRLWPDSFVEENNLTQQISQLRRALGEGKDGQSYIETMPKFGYRFVPEVRELVEGEGELVLSRRTRTHIVVRKELEEEQETESAFRFPERSRRIAITLAVIAILVTGIYSGRLLVQRSRTAATPARVATSSPVAGAALQAPDIVVILPFRSLRPQQDSDFLGAALANVVRDELSFNSEIVEHPSTPLNTFDGVDPLVDRNAEGTQRRVTVSGTYLKKGDRVSLFPDLVAEPGHVTLWHGSLTGSMRSLASLQEALSEQIGIVLHVPLERLKVRSGTKPPLNSAGYEYFLRGMVADNEDAIRWHEKAVKTDPGFGPALAYLAFDYVAYCYQYSASLIPPTEVEDGYLNKSAALFQMAIEKNAVPPGILSQGGLYFMELGRLYDLVALLRRAVELNPNYAQAHLWLSQVYRYGGMLEASRSEAELAFKLDAEIRDYSTINTYIYLGEHNKFLESLPRWQIGARTLFYSGLARYYMHDVSGAERDLRKAYEMQPEHPHAQFAHALLNALASENEQGLRQLRLFDKHYLADGEMLYKSAQAHAVLGDKQSAIRLLRRSIEHDFYCYPYFKRDPLLDSLRDDSEFVEVMELARARHEAFRRKFFQR